MKRRNSVQMTIKKQSENQIGRLCVCVCVRACVRACVCVYTCPTVTAQGSHLEFWQDDLARMSDQLLILDLIPCSE